MLAADPALSGRVCCEGREEAGVAARVVAAPKSTGDTILKSRPDFPAPSAESRLGHGRRLTRPERFDSSVSKTRRDRPKGPAACRIEGGGASPVSVQVTQSAGLQRADAFPRQHRVESGFVVGHPQEAGSAGTTKGRRLVNSDQHLVVVHRFGFSKRRTERSADDKADRGLPLLLNTEAALWRQQSGPAFDHVGPVLIVMLKPGVVMADVMSPIVEQHPRNVVTVPTLFRAN